MPILVEISRPDVYQRIGTYEHEQPFAGDLDPAFDAPTYALWLFWPDNLSWLTVGGSVDGDPRVEFADKPDAVDAVFADFGRPRDQLLPAGQPKFFEQNRSIAAPARKGSRVVLRISIDTDNRDFQQAAQALLDSDKDEFACEIGVCALAATGATERGRIVLKLKPLRRLPAYDGVAALDLGNTNSAVASLDGGRSRTHELKVLTADGVLSAVPGTAAVPSHVRVDEVLTWDPIPAGATRRFPSLPRDDFPQAARWVIGQLATVAGQHAQALILGAKRLMAGRRCEESMGIVTAHNNQAATRPVVRSERIELVHRAPAELLACRLLQLFSRARGEDGRPAGWPRLMAFTYPTTFSPQEIDRLRRTVYRAWLRLQFRRQAPQAAAQAASDPHLDRTAVQLQQRLANPKLADTDDPLIGLLLDEASAAAFFFLYRKVFESPGGLVSFRYLYPDGLNLLLYDCGGGTTDVALVRAHVDPANPARLRIGIRGRTGVRHFGGDNITLAVARLLKAKLARAIAQNQNRDRVPPLPLTPEDGALPWSRRAEVEAFLSSMNGLAREFVPTTFDRFQTDLDTQARRQRATTLWTWAQDLKHLLEGAESVKLADLKMRLGPSLTKLAEALLLHHPANSPGQQVLIDELSKVSINRWEVDALVGPEIARSVRNCNALIRESLTRPPSGRRDGRPADEEYVHWVVVTGNGSRYPLVRRLLEERLDVPFPASDVKEGWHLHFDPENMKNAVAKGAALALAALRGRVLADIRFDTDMSACLPFDVAYWDRDNQYQTLFKSETRYDQLGRRTVPVAAIRPTSEDAAQRTRTEFALMRRFPGDGANPAPEDGIPADPHRGWGPYLTFDFAPDGIQGDLEVAYDVEAQQFTVRDKKSGADGKMREDGPEDGYFPPAQSGEL